MASSPTLNSRAEHAQSGAEKEAEGQQTLILLRTEVLKVDLSENNEEILKIILLLVSKLSFEGV